MKEKFLLVWLDKNLKGIHTKIGSYEELKDYSKELIKNDDVISVDLYEYKESIKNEVGKFFLNKNKNEE